MKNHKHYEIAYRAHVNTSVTPDKRAESWCAGFDQDIEKLKSLDVPEEKIAKYESLWIKHMQAKSRCMSAMITGPANFPTARNEKANNAERRAGDACLEYYNKLVKYAEQEKYYAENPEARPVMSGDSDALDRLRDKLEALQKAQDTMKAVNAAIRTNDRAEIVKLLGSEEKADKILEPDCYGGIGFAGYALRNYRANIKRIEGRIKQLEGAKAKPAQEIDVNGVRVVQNPEDMRLELYFDGKPSAEIRSVLKSNAFKWSPSKGAWQRQLTNNAIYSFKQFVKPALESMGA